MEINKKYIGSILMAALPRGRVDNNVHNAFIERTIGPQLIRISTELYRQFPSIFQGISPEDSMPRLKDASILKELKPYFETLTRLPISTIEGLQHLMKNIDLSQIPNQVDFQKFLKKTLETPEDDYWNKVVDVTGRIHLISNVEIFGLLSLALRKLSLPPPPDEDGGVVESKASDLPSEVSHWAALWDAFQHQKEDFDIGCGTFYRNFLMMFLQSQGYPDLKIVLSERACVRDALGTFLKVLTKDLPIQAKAGLLYERLSGTALSTLLEPLASAYKAAHSEERRETYVSLGFHLDPLSQAFVEYYLPLYTQGFAFIEKEIKDIKEALCGQLPSHIEATFLNSEPSDSFFQVERYLGVSNNPVLEGRLSFISTYAPEPFNRTVKEETAILESMAQDLWEIFHCLQTLCSLGLHKTAEAQSYKLLVEDLDGISTFLDLKNALNTRKTRISEAKALLDKDITQRNGSDYAEITNIFSLLFADFSEEQMKSASTPFISWGKLQQFLIPLAKSSKKDLSDDYLLGTMRVIASDSGIYEINLHDINQILMYSLRYDPKDWSFTFYQVFKEVLNLIDNNFEGSHAVVRQGLKLSSYPPFLMHSMRAAQARYAETHSAELSSEFKMDAAGAAEPEAREAIEISDSLYLQEILSISGLSPETLCAFNVLLRSNTPYLERYITELKGLLFCENQALYGSNIKKRKVLHLLKTAGMEALIRSIFMELLTQKELFRGKDLARLLDTFAEAPVKDLIQDLLSKPEILEKLRSMEVWVLEKTIDALNRAQLPEEITRLLQDFDPIDPGKVADIINCLSPDLLEHIVQFLKNPSVIRSVQSGNGPVFLAIIFNLAELKLHDSITQLFQGLSAFDLSKKIQSTPRFAPQLIRILMKATLFDLTDQILKEPLAWDIANDSCGDSIIETLVKNERFDLISTLLKAPQVLDKLKSETQVYQLIFSLARSAEGHLWPAFLEEQVMRILQYPKVLSVIIKNEKSESIIEILEVFHLSQAVLWLKQATYPQAPEEGQAAIEPPQ